VTGASAPGPTPEELARGVLAGKSRPIGRAISEVERDSGDVPEILRRVFRETGRARIIGITGPPGAGKSTLVLRLAQAYRRQYRVEPRLELARRAVELYRIYLDKVKRGGRVGDAADSLGEMQREVDKLTAAGAKAAAAASVDRTRLGISPQLTAETKGGDLHEIADLPETTETKLVTLLDGKPVTPFEMVEVAPGPHTIHVEAEGYLPNDTTERAVKGVSSVVEVVLQPQPAKVTIATTAGAKIRVDGRPAGTAPLAAPLDVPAGRHVVAISHAGRDAVAREITVTRGQTLAMREPLEKTTRRKLVPWVATGGIALGALAVTGGVFALVEDSRASDQLAAIQKGDQPPSAAARYQLLLDRRDRATTAMYVTGGAALVLGAAAAALYWFDSPSDDSLRVTALPGGAAVSGHF